MSKKHNKPNIANHDFYMQVYSYITQEYNSNYSNIYADSFMSESIANLVGQYYYGGNTVPFVAGQVVDLIKSKYKC